MSDIIITEQNFESEILNSSIPVLVDFWAPWCGPCRMLAPVIEELAKEYDGKLKIAKLNTDECGNLAGQYKISSIPTLILFKDKNPVQTIIGFKAKNEIKKIIENEL
ncbi:thioredoxin [Elusimicrobiota bacterium]